MDWSFFILHKNGLLLAPMLFLLPLVACNFSSGTATKTQPNASAVILKGTASLPATSAQVLLGSQYWDSTGALQEGTMLNQGAPDFENAWLGDGFYSGSPIHVPVASEIVSGNTILGVMGSANFASLAGSNASRTLGTTQITQQIEAINYGSTLLPAGYRDVPDITLDDDGFEGGSVTYATRPTVTCGSTQTTISARIAACATANGVNATWSGSVNGNAGQGTWNLVTYAGMNSQYPGVNAEVWQDAQTGLLWSSLVAESSFDNWCRAAGNAQSGDPSNYCNSTTYQPLYPLAESYCSETGTIPAVASEAVGSVLGGAWNGTYLLAKGEMGAQASSNSPSVYWRLPTVYDYHQAEVDGVRFVLPDMGPTSTNSEWTATVSSANRSLAWIFVAVFGGMPDVSRHLSYSVRCIGR